MTDSGGPSFYRLFALLYIFSTGALAINLFMLGLMAQAIGFPALSPKTALLISLPLGLFVNWIVTRWVRRLIQEAEANQ